MSSRGRKFDIGYVRMKLQSFPKTVIRSIYINKSGFYEALELITVLQVFLAYKDRTFSALTSAKT